MLTRRALAVTVIPIAVALLQPLAFAGSPSPLAVADAAAVLDPARITQRRLLAHVRFLASDQLEGRDSASRGNELATLYIASHFEQLGLEPVGSTPDGATGPRRFFQPFRLAATAFENVSLEVDGQPLRPGPDFAIFPWSGGGRATSELVFCGYGITAPEHDYDDYDGIDIKGKVVLVLRHEPRERERESWFEGRTHTRHARFDTKLENAIRHGAAGLVLVNDPIHCGGQRHFGSSGGRAISGLAGGANGDGDRPDDDGGPGIPFVFAGKRLVEQVSRAIDLEALQREIDASRQPRSRATGVQVTLGLDRRRETLPTWNVAAALRGADPAVRDEWVVIGAHLDHEGIRGGEVMNGANDNASGTAALLEIAGAFVHQPVRPRRSVLFIAFNAEEKGLLGSRYYVEHPLVPLDQTVAMINMDMVGRSTRNTVLAMGGFYCHVLDRSARLALERAGIAEPNFAGSRVNARSDHFPFFAREIPVLVFHSDDEGDYHQPGDDVEKLTLDMMQRIVHAVADTTWMVANAAERPRFRRLQRF